MSACNPFDLLQASACFANLTGPQLQVIIANLLCSILQASNAMASCDPNTILAANPCMANRTSYELLVIQTQLLCEILQTGGGGGGGNACLVAQSGGPVDPCTFAFGLGYDPDPASPTAGQFWYWDSIDGVWVKFIQ